MINSANSVDIKVINHGTVLLQPGVVPLDKCKLVHTTKIPQIAGERFTSSYAIQSSLDSYNNNANKKVRVDIQKDETKEIHRQPQRVHVQHLKTHPNLQNNRWSSHTFYNLSSEVIGTTQNTGLSNINLNNNLIGKESAFSLSSSSNNNSYNISASNTSVDIKDSNVLGYDGVIPSIREVDSHGESSDRRMSSVHRTAYQENAFLRIEDVHNYAKLDHYSYSNESSNSSIHEGENEDEDEELDDDTDDDNDDAATNYERYLRNSRQFAARNRKAYEEAKPNMSYIRVTRMETEETERNVDVETVHTEQNEPGATVLGTPDHHARRPMNAFLIFCKRHRAIVKERYKSLENRAITKILGDWWASLDVSDKKCFTNLAQQNKDAFFNANPNFKWYKLPAPPLRTLNTRPGNNDRNVDQEDDIKSVTAAHFVGGGTLSKYANKNSSHVFKFADEAQMGELSTLINNEGNNNNINANQNALQQALGETTQFLNSYMPPSSENDGNQSSKSRLINENSFSSNGSEDDVLPKKSSRSCKGKIYQELINSGQISAVSKKVRTPKSQNHPNSFANQTVSPSLLSNPTSLEGSNNVTSICTTLQKSANNVGMQETSKLEGSHSNNDFVSFDLEEKIKELPALSLDLYLQRKRNTKKKNKFTSKKRSSSNASSSKNLGVANVIPISSVSASIKNQGPPQQAVGSQKRKARKESITRRDVTAIENEIASVIPLSKSFNTINGCYFFNESADSSVSKPLLGETAKSAIEMGTDNQQGNVFDNLSNDNITSTSDLLILAEVAANRTELTN